MRQKCRQNETKEQDRAKAEDVTQRCMEKLGETKKIIGEKEVTPKRKRSTGSETVTREIRKRVIGSKEEGT